jgi:hypothetical protein
VISVGAYGWAALTELDYSLLLSAQDGGRLSPPPQVRLADALTMAAEVKWSVVSERTARLAVRPPAR